MGISDQSVSHVALLDSVIKVLCLLLQSHRPPFDERDASASEDPDLARRAGLVHPNVPHFVIPQPALSVKILPAIPAVFGLRIDTRGPLIAAQPNSSGLLSGEDFEAGNRSGFFACPGFRMRDFPDTERNFVGSGRVVAHELLGLGQSDVTEQKQARN